MEVDALRPFLAGPWHVQPRRGRVVSLLPGEERPTEIRLSPKFILVLAALARAGGDVVTRDELLEEVWSGTVVGESVLTRAVSELRRALSAHPDASEPIETIPKIGYRLLLTVQWVDQPPPVPQAVQIGAVPPVAGSDPVPASYRSLQMVGALVLLIFLSVSLWYVFLRSVEDVRPGAVRIIPITSLPGEEFDASFSPDGRYIAFVRVSELDGQSDIFYKELGAAGEVQLTRSEWLEMSPTWSPSGTHVAFVRCDPQSFEAGIYSTPLSLGGEAQLLLDLTVAGCGDTPSLAWSPDGGSILFPQVQDDGETQPIVRLELAANVVTTVTAPEPGMKDDMPRFSPDGMRLAFVRGRRFATSSMQIHVQEVSGNNPARLVSRHIGEMEGFDWMQDGQSFVMASRGVLWEIDSASGAETFITAPGTDVVEPVVSAATGQIVFVQSLFDINVWSLDTQSGEAVPLLATTRVDGDPRISPDGSRIAFITDRDGTCSVMVALRDGTSVGALASFDTNCFNMHTPRWSPDGLHVAFVKSEDENSDIFVVSTVGGAVNRITDHEGSDTVPGWSADSRRLYFVSDRGGQDNVWAVDLGQAAIAYQVTTDGGTSAAESLDGKWLWLTKPGLSGLWRMRATGAAIEQVIDGLDGRDVRNWRVTEHGITWVERTPAPVLMAYDEDSGQTRRVVTLPEEMKACLSVDLAPNAAWAVCSRVDRDEDDLHALEVVIGS